MNQVNRIAPTSIASQIARFSTIALSGVALLAALCLAPAPASAQTLRMGGGSPPPSGGPQTLGAAPAALPPRSAYRGEHGAQRGVSAPVLLQRAAPTITGRPMATCRTTQRPVPYGRLLSRARISRLSYGQWTPGYWAYTWVPQGQATSVWVPGYYDRDGVWVAGYHAAQVTQSGYYQPYWVSGYWAP